MHTHFFFVAIFFSSLPPPSIPSWEKFWDGGAQTAVGYVRDAAARRQALSTWMSRAESGSLLTLPLRLSELLSPATFLNACLQHTARASTPRTGGVAFSV